MTDGADPGLGQCVGGRRFAPAPYDSSPGYLHSHG